MWLLADIRSELERFTSSWRTTMARRPTRTPEEQAAWDQRTRIIEERIAYHERRIREERTERERRRARLRRLSFGLLGRG